MSVLKQHIDNWKSCTKCQLHKTRKHTVFYRGSVPAEVLYLGEAPGDSEDVNAVPFIGPAGILLNEIIAKAEQDAKINPSNVWGNLCCCIPRDSEGHKNGAPNKEEIAACHPRLEEFLRFCKPKMIVCVGEVAKKEAIAQKWAERSNGVKGYSLNNGRIRVIDITHPAALLRLKSLDKAKFQIDVDRAVVRLTNALEELIPF